RIVAGMAAGRATTVKAVVRAKAGVPGRAKTRLIPAIGADAAAGVHDAMLACVVRRLERWWAGPRVLAMTGEGWEPAAAGLVGDREGWAVVDQGDGDLGARLERVWRGEAVGGAAVAFFGVDSPDVPAEALAAMPGALAGADAAVGPVGDGGYWTLLAAEARRGAALLERIDWGSERVHRQTHDRAAAAGLRCVDLPAWHDVDDIDDLTAMRRRLLAATEPGLVELRAALDKRLGALRP
ncbi:MAG: TIGR04282 family arsenosugar biosynthesis glycosyltransferase, partial [Planctomycetota bacterium]